MSCGSGRRVLRRAGVGAEQIEAIRETLELLEAPTTGSFPESLPWLQLAKVAEGHVVHRLCPGCREWFTLGEGARRPQTRAHGAACRKRAPRMRRAQARKK